MDQLQLQIMERCHTPGTHTLTTTTNTLGICTPRRRTVHRTSVRKAQKIEASGTVSAKASGGKSTAAEARIGGCRNVVGKTGLLWSYQAFYSEGISPMAAMKPRTGDGPMEAVEEGHKIVMRIPTDGGGRLVVELNHEEAGELASVLSEAAG